MPDFLDFRLIANRIAGVETNRFVTAVVEAPISRFGQSFGQFTLEEKDAVHWQVSSSPLIFKLDAERRFRLDQSDVQRALSEEAVGTGLFQLLFPQGSAARELLGRSCERIGQHKYLRLKLELHPDLSNLPWEIMGCPLAEPWAEQINRAKISIIRYLGDVSDQIIYPSPESKPSILIVRADPEECASRDVTDSLYKEWNRLESALERLKDRIEYRMVTNEGTLSKLIQLVEELERDHCPVTGIHFMGHGWIDERGGFFAGENDERRMHRIYASDLKKALDRATSIRWMILNACWTAAEPIGCPLAGLATSMSILKNIPTIIAYKRPVGTTDAEILAAHFYEQVLGNGRPIEEVIRFVQFKCSNPGGLVILARSEEGRIQDIIQLGTKPDPETQAAVPNPETSQMRTIRPVDKSSVEGNVQFAKPPARDNDANLDRMILVPAGPFKKGLQSQQIDLLLSQFQREELPLDSTSARKALSQEVPESVELPAFLIDATLVRNAQFSRFVESTGHITQAEYAGDPQNWRIYGGPEKVDHPVVCVSYNDAEAYCRWAGKRLPTADEWKKAYRGPEGRVYPWGDIFDGTKCNTAESCPGYETTPVDMFSIGASYYGCLDMLGNVEEWTLTPAGSGRIILGGSWAMTCMVYGLPVLHRISLANFYSNDLGFRCVRDVKST